MSRKIYTYDYVKELLLENGYEFISPFDESQTRDRTYYASMTFRNINTNEIYKVPAGSAVRPKLNYINKKNGATPIPTIRSQREVTVEVNEKLFETEGCKITNINGERITYTYYGKEFLTIYDHFVNGARPHNNIKDLVDRLNNEDCELIELMDGNKFKYRHNGDIYQSNRSSWNKGIRSHTCKRRRWTQEAIEQILAKEDCTLISEFTKLSIPINYRHEGFDYSVRMDNWIHGNIRPHRGRTAKRLK